MLTAVRAHMCQRNCLFMCSCCQMVRWTSSL